MGGKPSTIITQQNKSSEQAYTFSTISKKTSCADLVKFLNSPNFQSSLKAGIIDTSHYKSGVTDEHHCKIYFENLIFGTNIINLINQKFNIDNKDNDNKNIIINPILPLQNNTSNNHSSVSIQSCKYNI